MSRQYPSRPYVGVGAVIFKDDHVLLIKRNKPPKEDEWSIPGGAQMTGETVKDALLREVFEETGLHISLTSLIDVVDFIETDHKNDFRFHYTLIDFAADYNGGSLHPGSDATQCEWVALDKIDGYNLWSETIRVITKASQRRNN